MTPATTAREQDAPTLHIDIELMRKRLLMMRTNLLRQLDQRRARDWDDEDDGGGFADRRAHARPARAGGSRQKMAEVEAALRKMDSGTYGLCESCGSTIVKARLLAVPFARHCVVCQDRACR